MTTTMTNEKGFSDFSQIKLLLDALSLKEYKINLSISQMMKYTFHTLLVFAALIYIIPSKLLLILLILMMALIILLYLALYRNSVSRKFDQEKVDELLRNHESKSSATVDDSFTG